MQHEVVVLVEVHGPDQPAVIRKGKRHWEQWISPDMIAEIGSSPLALYTAEQIERVWHFKKRVDLGAKVVLREMVEGNDGDDESRARGA